MFAEGVHRDAMDEPERVDMVLCLPSPLSSVRAGMSLLLRPVPYYASIAYYAAASSEPGLV